jgi:hypothetical protein
MYSYDAKAIQGFDDTQYGRHYIPGTIFPSLNSGNQGTTYVFFGAPTFMPATLDYTGPAKSVDAVSAVFMHETIMNEYVTDDAINAATEWVVTFPTKNFYADPLRMVQAGLFDDVDDAVAAGARQPFTRLYQEDFLKSLDCEAVFLQTWDREEAYPESPDTPVGVRPPVVSPSLPICEDEFDPRCQDPVAPFQICNEVNILRFGEREVFNSPEFLRIHEYEDPNDSTKTLTKEQTFSLVYEVDSPFEDGWARLDFGGPSRVDQNGLLGLPVTGFAAQEYENNFLEGGVKANYGGLFQHKGNVRQAASATTP